MKWLGCLGVVVLVALIVGGMAIGSYNALVRLGQGVDAQWAQVENQYQRRADLIPNLVATVSGAADFEKSTLEEVVKARASVGQVNVGNLPNDPAAFARFQAAQDSLSGALSRLMVVVGPCSVHDPKAALDYANRLAALSRQLDDRLLVVMRVYFEKPRTTTGWKGLINDPHLDGSGDVNAGLRIARELLLRAIAIACVVLAFTRPMWWTTGLGAGERKSASATVFVVDMSLSTAQRSGGTSVFERLKATVVTEIDSLQTGVDVAAVVWAGDQATSVFPRLTANLPELKTEVARTAVGEDVDLSLVLAVDVSRSIDDDEFVLQRRGYADAFTNAAVINAIRSTPRHKIAVLFVEWAGADFQRVVVPWTVVSDGESGQLFAEAILREPRSFWGWTSISGAIDFGAREIERAPHQAKRKVIDVSGDGVNNSGRASGDARDRNVRASGSTGLKRSTSGSTRATNK